MYARYRGGEERQGEKQRKAKEKKSRRKEKKHIDGMKGKCIVFM